MHKSRWVGGVAFVLLSAGVLRALEVTAKLKKIDVDAGVLVFEANGKERTAKVAKDAPVIGADGKLLADGLKSPELKEGAEARLTIEPEGNRPVVKSIKLGAKPAEPAKDEPPRFDTSELKPLTDMKADDAYHGFKGGLYPEGKNERPAAHEKAGQELAAKVRLLDRDGKPSALGKIVLLTIGFSNTLQCSKGFLDAAHEDKDVNPHVVLVNGAQGGRSAFMIQNPDDGSIGEQYWKEWVAGKLKAADVTAAQVQVIWLKETDAALGAAVLKMLGVKDYEPPTKQGFPRGARTLQGELEKIVQALPRLYPNVKLVYVSSRSFGGWAKREGNKEPFSYETGYAVKWLIEKQLAGDPDLNFDPARGPVKAPWLSWGPYLWANGEHKRGDGFSFRLDDYREDDRMHHSADGIKKMGGVLLRFFKIDATTKGWFVKTVP